MDSVGNLQRGSMRLDTYAAYVRARWRGWRGSWWKWATAEADSQIGYSTLSLEGESWGEGKPPAQVTATPRSVGRGVQRHGGVILQFESELHLLALREQ